MKKYYRIYGMYIQSDLEIEEAIEIEKPDAIDISIIEGNMPPAIQEKIKEYPLDVSLAQYNSSSFFFRVGGIASYFITRDEIIVDKVTDAQLMAVKCYLLGSAFGFCMFLRNRIVLHGGGIAQNGKGIIVTGESGAGKSTVCNALRGNGFAFIADDVCAISKKDECMHIDMAYPQQKLCRDAAIKMGYDLTELIYINESKDKYAIRLKEGYLPEGEKFSYLFEIVFSEDDELSFKKLEGHEKLFAVIRNIYRGESSIKQWGLLPEAMKICTQIAATIDVYQISRPRGKDTVSEIVKEIKRVVEKPVASFIE